jgi:hypothetical protein
MNIREILEEYRNTTELNKEIGLFKAELAIKKVVLKEILKKIPKKETGKHKNCFEIDGIYCIKHQENVDIHPEHISGYNQYRAEVIKVIEGVLNVK